MEGSDGSPPLSLGEIVRAAELFPKSPLEKDDKKLTVPFNELPGESVKYLGRTDDGVLALSNYRLFIKKKSIKSETSAPLGLIESAQVRDLFHLIINCKDASTIKCSFVTSETCLEWHKRILLTIGVPDKLESLFAFSFYAWTSEAINFADNDLNRLKKGTNSDRDFFKEVKRLKFDIGKSWRISDVNNDFKLCSSYPRYILVPNNISEDTLQNVASFRSSRRIPAVVWRHRDNGAIIARCSQPEVGWLGWRNSKDEQLLKAIFDACQLDRDDDINYGNGTTLNTSTSINASDTNLYSSPSQKPSSETNGTVSTSSSINTNMDEPKKILIVDARSYTSAVTNRARGGGCECPEYYPCAEIQFMNLGNIHAIRKSFHALRQLCASPPDIPNWLGVLEKTAWLQHMAGLLTANMVVCHAIDQQERPVLVHCSDGWDRTPQIVATAQLCLDPYYRTIEGFRVLVEREWLSFGHKFADRCGHGPGSDELNERCPVFLQWLDCVHQIHRQFPCSFEFNMAYLIKLAQHSNSCLFGTFLCNTVKERNENTVLERTFSVWPFLSSPFYKNPLYVPYREKVLWPAHNVRDLALWNEVYLGSLGNGNINCSDNPPQNAIERGGDTVGNDTLNSMTKTRSYGDLISAGESQNGLTRRSSDPSMIIDPHALINSTDNSIDSSSDQEILPGLLEQNLYVSSVRDTTIQLQNLTNDLNQSDEELENNNQNLYRNNNLNNSNSVSNGKLLNEDEENEDNNDHHVHRDDDANADLMARDFYRSTVASENRNGGDTSMDTTGIMMESSQFNYHQQKNIDFLEKLKQECNVIENDYSKYVTNSNSTTNGGDDRVDGYKGFNNDIMLHSIDLNDTPKSNSPTKSLWYGSVETSTDTLVPIEVNNDGTATVALTNSTTLIATTATNGDALLTHKTKPNPYMNGGGSIINGDQFDGGGSDGGGPDGDTNIMCNGSGSGNGEMKTILDNESDNLDNSIVVTKKDLIRARTISTGSQMDESIFIQPEFEKLDINIKLDKRRNSINFLPNNKLNNDLSPNKNYINDRVICYSTSPSISNSRLSTPGGRSLPMTPPGSTIDRPAIAISCPDGLAHALSEQNLRLQQLVYEHKLKEEALQKELYATRMELLKRNCPQCSTHTFFIEEPISINDSNLENSSVCSWEAVDDNNGINTGINSQNDLWVPDHAASHCAGCRMIFWLGRRKHHCRSCGQIFCADCSEYRASIPDKRLYTTVRLCASCYNNQICSSTTKHSQDRIPPPTTQNSSFNHLQYNNNHHNGSVPPSLSHINSSDLSTPSSTIFNNYHHHNSNNSIENSNVSSSASSAAAAVVAAAAATTTTNLVIERSGAIKISTATN